MNAKEFSILKAQIRNAVKRKKEKGDSPDNIHYWLIGYLTGRADTEGERTYTEAQLKELFDMAF